MTRRPRTTNTFERIIYTVIFTGLFIPIGYNYGLSVAAHRAIPRDSTPIADASALTPVRFVVSYRDTLRSGLVIEVIEDRIWHNATITVKYFGNNLASAEIGR